jgi:hypothetical protein
VSTESVPVRGGIDWRRAEFILTAVAFLCFLLIPVQIKTIYSGLPAHPLFLHVPVVLIPLSVLGAIALVIKPAWFRRYGIALCTMSVVAMGGLFVTMGAGSQLRSALGLYGNFGVASLIARHEHAADILRLCFIGFTAIVIVAFAAERISSGMPTGAGIIDRLLQPRGVVIFLRTALVALAIASGYMCFKTGDLGAKAVWAGRLSHSGFGGAPGGFGGGAGGGSVGGGSVGGGVGGLFRPSGG